jgi:hypothetical protein
LRLEQEASEKLRLEQEAFDAAEKLRVEQEAERERI